MTHLTSARCGWKRCKIFFFYQPLLHFQDAKLTSPNLSPSSFVWTKCEHVKQYRSKCTCMSHTCTVGPTLKICLNRDVHMPIRMCLGFLTSCSTWHLSSFILCFWFFAMSSARSYRSAALLTGVSWTTLLRMRREGRVNRREAGRIWAKSEGHVAWQA